VRDLSSAECTITAVCRSPYDAKIVQEQFVYRRPGLPYEYKVGLANAYDAESTTFET
jgi:hypothetical protein